ncbi:RDD family protein [Janibacter indicus]|uniref:RDD family protein n=1 Tax=Janibacter indicus TaxID=857417 RepID=A0A7L9J1G3_9MICO|nr:RDD family protein [Janibacter indicus]QOK23169.1 RDD family protein [Janibacter indicus]
MTDPTQGGLPGQPPQGAPMPPQGSPTPPPGAPTPPTGAPQPGPPSPYPVAGGSDPGRPGSRAWVEQRYGRTAGFGDRILPGIIDSLLGMAAAFIPVILGIVCIVAGMPDTYDCGVYYTRTCEVPGSGSGGLVGLGILLIFLSFLAAIAMAAWNRVWRVTKTGQSIGKKVTGLKVIDAESGKHPQLGPAALRELVHQVAGIISWIWMLVDDDDRTLADIVGKTHVVHVGKD